MVNVEYKAEKLSARNYSTWKTVIQAHLMSKDLWALFVADNMNVTDDQRLKNNEAKHPMYISMEPQQIANTGVCDSQA